MTSVRRRAAFAWVARQEDQRLVGEGDARCHGRTEREPYGVVARWGSSRCTVVNGRRAAAHCGRFVGGRPDDDDTVG